MSRFRHWLVVLPLLASANIYAEPPTVQLKIDRNTGLTVSGAEGSICAIQYKSDLAKTTSWHCQSFHQFQSSPVLVPNTAPNSGASRLYRVATVTTPSNMVYITSGSFLLGSPTNEVDRYDDEGPQTSVSFTSGFFMATKPVTQREYLAVVGSNPSFFTGDLERPVEQVSWSNATNYCALLTQRELNARRIAAGTAFRLPTEAEWEYCCRAGTTTRFFYGNDPNYLQLTNHAWFYDNSYFPANDDWETHPVGTKPANPWGLYDMTGNVWQWCQDWYGPYLGDSVSDPKGAATGSNRVLRGGSYTDSGRFCRTACRIGDDPSINFFSFYGFRVVLAPAN